MDSQNVTVHRYRTPCGLLVERTSEPVAASRGEVFQTLARALDQARGALLSCTFEYPGRYQKRTVGFRDPPLVLESRLDTFVLRALNERGELLLTALLPMLSDQVDFGITHASASCLEGRVARCQTELSEEARTQKSSILSVVRALRRALYDESDVLLGLYGALGYDLVFQFEALTRMQARDEQRELVLYMPDELLVHDEASGSCQRHRYEFSLGERTTHALPRSGARHPFVHSSEPVEACDHEPGDFERGVELAKAAFARGDLFEATLSQTFRRSFAGHPSQLFSRLERDNPAPYGFLINLGHGELLVGASPEMYVRVTGRRVETCPIAGTIARGADALADAAQIQRLLASSKDEAELTMCTDVDRNDKARICEPGSVRVLGRRQIELYSRLIHTVDHVEGTLREGYDGIDALLTHMWAVTVTGAPKLDAMQLIEQHEKSPRRFYAGAVGAIRFDGNVDTGLTLRTVHLRAGVAEVRTGATLLFDSDPQAERRESELKASALLDALAHCAHEHEPARAHEPPPRRALRAALPVLLIDHRDSFVHTLADYFRQADCQVTTLRHGFDESAYSRLGPALVVLSPGPKRPADFQLHETLDQLRRRDLTVFGVCLGLQAMVEHAGGQLAQLETPRHGKASELRTVSHSPLFEGLPARFSVGRYHSLHAVRASLPVDLTVVAETVEDDCVMALQHRTLPWYAVQFHPESILSAEAQLGLRMIENVVAIARAR